MTRSNSGTSPRTTDGGSDHAKEPRIDRGSVNPIRAYVVATIFLPGVLGALAVRALCGPRLVLGKRILIGLGVGALIFAAYNTPGPWAWAGIWVGGSLFGAAKSFALLGSRSPG